MQINKISRNAVIKIISIWIIIGIIIAVGKSMVIGIIGGYAAAPAAAPVPAAQEEISVPSAIEDQFEEEIAYSIADDNPFESFHFNGDQSQAVYPEAKPMKKGRYEYPQPVAYAPASTSLLTEGVLISLITTVGATLNTLLLVFKRKKE